MSEMETSNGEVTVVLVDGAFADSPSWNGVVEASQPQTVTDSMAHA